MMFELLEVFLCFALVCMLMLTAVLVYYLLDGIAFRKQFLELYAIFENRKTQKLWHKKRVRKNPAKNTKKKLKKTEIGLAKMKNGCTVSLKELENSSPIAGVTTVTSSNLLFFKKAFGLSEGCTRKDQRTAIGVFSTSESSFFVLTRNGAKRENRNKTDRSPKCIASKTSALIRRNSSSRSASISNSQSESLAAWSAEPRGNTPTGNSVFPISSCASCLALSTSLSKLWTRRGAGIELNYRYLTA